MFTLTSTFEGGTPNVVAEALTAGCAMAVTKFDAWEDAIDEGRCGMAAKINDIDEIAMMYLELCKNANLEQLSEQKTTKIYEDETEDDKFFDDFFSDE